MTSELTEIAAEIPDARLLEYCSTIAGWAVALSAVVSLMVLASWTFSIEVPSCFDIWKMKSNTALCLFLAALTVAFRNSSGWPSRINLDQILPYLIIILAVDALLGHLFGLDLGLRTLLASDPFAGGQPGLMSIQSALVLVVLAITIAIDSEAAGVTGILRDSLCLLLAFVALVLFIGHMFGAIMLIGQDKNTVFSVYTLFCTSTLVLSVLCERAERGSYFLLVDSGARGRFFRAMLLPILVGPILLVFVGAELVNLNLLTVPYAASIVAIAITFFLGIGVIFITGRIGTYEVALQRQTITDDLTGLLNRRGFNMLGDQALALAKRNGYSCFVVYIDADGLKKVNDIYGHAAGSEMLVDISIIIRQCFRDVDIKGRIGGDEFCVFCTGDHALSESIIKRLESQQNGSQDDSKPYRVRFSYGIAFADSSQTLETLVHAADAEMYKFKLIRQA